ncbi:roundabout homolog 1-like [Plakobranchus ocellatus]|uniref:Roundabout homolog 1-like n=1 Tax=Plakobranchus ocellatus TaxID=259542 RepID=A0AAV4DV03_9GAST|nr:roundabout homolog 1-like [Plakobranchus ocellatus]
MRGAAVAVAAAADNDDNDDDDGGGGPEKTTLIQEAWFIWVLVGTICGTLWLALCVFTAECCTHEHCEGLASPSSDSGSVTTDENGVQVKRPHKYSRITGPVCCPNCTNCAGAKQGQQPHVNLAELLPPPPEHPPPHHEMMMVGHNSGAPSRDGGGGGAVGDMGSRSLQRHNPHAYLYAGDNPGTNMAETRFIENRCSPASPASKMSSCSCPPGPVPHDRMLLPGMRANINNNNPNMPYSDMEYPVHSHAPHHASQAHSLHNAPHHQYPRFHGGDGGPHPDGGGANTYNPERPYSPKLLNTARAEGGGGSSSGSNRCQSPLSCHNCGSSFPQQQQQQPPPPPAPPSSSSSSNNSQPQQQAQAFNPNNPHFLYSHHPDSRMVQNTGGGVYPQVGGAYPPGTHNHQPIALHGYRIPPMEAEFKGSEEGCGVSMDRACQSSLPSLANDCLQAGYGRRPDSPPSEEHQDYGVESDMDGQQRVECHSPDSSVNGDGGSASGSMQLAWPSATDDDTDSVSHDDSDHRRDDHDVDRDGHDDNDEASSSDSSFLADADFASAVARAAQLSGLTVVGTTVTDPKISGNGKKYRKHRNQPARPHSPYSTDSSMSAVVHKPYPKSDRKKQLIEQARKYGQRKDGAPQNMDIEEAGMVFRRIKSDVKFHPGFYRPLFVS